MAVFGDAKLPEWVELWLKALQERGLKWSSSANYVNCVFNVTSYVYAALEPTAEAMAAGTLAPDQLLRMRAQAEKMAKQQALYSRRDPNWIEWEDAQKGRVKVLAAWAAARSGGGGCE